MKKIYLLLATLVVLNLVSACKSNKKMAYFHNTYPSYATKNSNENKNPVPAENVYVSTETKLSEFDLQASKLENAELPVKNIQKNADLPTLIAKKKVTLSSSREKKKEVRSALKNQLKQESKKTGVSTFLLVIIAILVPPIAVLFTDGLRLPFWLDLLLTLVFYVPGLIYAIYRIVKHSRL